MTLVIPARFISTLRSLYDSKVDFGIFVIQKHVDDSHSGSNLN